MNQELKNVFKMFSYGMFILTSKSESIAASTITWVSQTSFDPALVLVALRNESLSLKVVLDSNIFAINILSEGDKEIASKFFRPPVVEGDTLNGFAFELGSLGVPLIKELPAYLECQVVECIKRGDHTIVIGEVKEAKVRHVKAPLTLASTGWRYEK